MNEYMKARLERAKESTTVYLDWPKVISPLMRRLQKAGFSLDRVWDSEEWHEVANSKAEAAEAICAVDEATIRISKEGETFGIYIVLGNGPDEVVCDHTCSDSEVSLLLEKTIEGHSIAWEGRKCPTMTVYEYLSHRYEKMK